MTREQMIDEAVRRVTAARGRKRMLQQMQELSAAGLREGEWIWCGQIGKIRAEYHRIAALRDQVGVKVH